MNPQALVSLYGKFPSFDGAELIDVHFKCDDPLVAVKFVTREKPKAWPKRWPSDYGEVLVGLSFIGVSRLSFEQWGYENVVDKFELKDVGEGVFVRISCKNEAALTFSCDWIRIESVTYGNIGSP
ncbi:hypothetical protein F7R23_22850 [Burkholderia diffusa]|nr:hypothetical protein F7R23_22850 [Burkholderia diffusa]MBM2653741.1 immunity 50 family protein [Burkholderia diffusa]